MNQHMSQYMPHPVRHSAKQRMRGFTMIELTISLALGVVVSLAATQLLLTNQVNSNYQRAMSDVQVSGRYVMDSIAAETRQAGLTNDAKDEYKGVPFVTAQLSGAAPYRLNQYKLNKSTVPGVLTDHDQLVVRRYNMSAGVDCEGNATAADTYVVSRYFLRTDTDTNQPALACDAGRVSAAGALTSYGDNGAVLMAGVESFSVEYGVRSGTTIRYLPASTIGTSYPTLDIASVRVSMYARSNERAGEPILPSAGVNVGNGRVIATSDAAFKDGRVRRLFVSTIAVRN